MLKPTWLTWLIAVFGMVTFLPLMAAQLVMLLNPSGQKAKDLLIGKGEDWRDKTHFRSALAFARADWLLVLPLFFAGTAGTLLGHWWGYVLWIALGAISIYFSTVFWVLEKEYTYPSCGPLVYYTYYWGFFLYWGIGAIIYSLLRSAAMRGA
ncbi:MAG: hypothetical protein GY765_30640 [bacterium]|nr:hypothetical protein [bacterium]